MSKEYTKLREGYAWVGFVTIVSVCIVVCATIALNILVKSISNPITYTKEVPQAKVLVEKDIAGIVSAYSSTVDQTDDTPFITASGQWVRKGIVANNCLEFGTWVRIEGDLYEVQDRMNSRYDCNHFDIWFETREEATNWGRQYQVIGIINS